MPEAAATTTLPETEIFRSGTHIATDGTKVTVTGADLAAIAAAYDPAIGEAPLVVGHPKLNAPAYGWTKQLTARDGILFAAAGEVDPAFREMVETGRFKKRSASFFQPDSPGNPKPGQLYLRHIGFLGAAAPGVTGLRDIQFAADTAGVVEFAANQPWWVLREIASLFRRIRDSIVADKGVEAADAVIPSYQIESINEAAQIAQIAADPSFSAPEPVMPEPTQTQTVDFAARETALSSREQQLAERETRIRQAERASTRKLVVEFAAALVASGQLLPKDQPAVVELLDALEGAEKPQVLNFAAPDGTAVQQPAAQTLRAFLSALPVRTHMGEVSADPGAGVAAVDFAAPANVAVDPIRLELHNKAVAYQRQHPGIAYIDAVRSVGGN